jgi:hypothetical protein
VILTDNLVGFAAQTRCKLNKLFRIVVPVPTTFIAVIFKTWFSAALTAPTGSHVLVAHYIGKDYNFLRGALVFLQQGSHKLDRVVPHFVIVITTAVSAAAAALAIP